MFAVMYHYVHPLRNAFIPGLKALELDDFILQLEYLDKNFTILSPDDFFGICEGEKRPSEKYVLLTFDDGYSDIYHYILPELNKRKLKGFFYIPDYFDKKGLLDVNAIHILLTNTSLVPEYIGVIKKYVNNYCADDFETYLQRVNYTSRYDTGGVQVIKQMLQFILPPEHRTKIINNLIDKYSGYDMPALFDRFYCTKAQLNTLIAEGMHIGGHGVAHVWLNKLPLDQQEKEINGSMRFLETLDAQPFYSFCYPFGGYNKDTLSLMKGSEFKFAFTTRPQNIEIGNDSVFELPRFDTNDIYPIRPLA